MSRRSDPMVGLQGPIDAMTVNNLRISLRRSWQFIVGDEPRNLDDDLELCRRWFNPVAQGNRLRRELAQLSEFPRDLHNPGNPFTLTVGPQKWLVTPEGRCCLDLLENFPSEQQIWHISSSDTAYYDRLLAHLYHDWSRHRIDSVVTLLEGSNKPLQIPAAGVLIALLVNGNIDKPNALARFPADEPGPRDLVDGAFFAAVNAFSDVLAPSRRGSRNSRLISGWMLYEARRRVGDGLVIQDASGVRNGKVWIRSECESDIIKVIARDLARGHRTKVTVSTFGSAFDALVQELRRELPRMAGFGLSHEKPTETRRLKARLLQSLDDYMGPLI